MVGGSGPERLLGQGGVRRRTLQQRLCGCKPIASLDRVACSGLDATKSLCLFFAGLEASMTKLGGCINELELDVLKRPSRGLWEQTLPKGDAPLAAAWNLALQMRSDEGHIPGQFPSSQNRTIHILENPSHACCNLSLPLEGSRQMANADLLSISPGNRTKHCQSCI